MFTHQNSAVSSKYRVIITSLKTRIFFLSPPIKILSFYMLINSLRFFKLLIRLGVLIMIEYPTSNPIHSQDVDSVLHTKVIMWREKKYGKNLDTIKTGEWKHATYLFWFISVDKNFYVLYNINFIAIWINNWMATFSVDGHLHSFALDSIAIRLIYGISTLIPNIEISFWLPLDYF